MSELDVTIRLLGSGDGPAYSVLRLEALRNEPMAFGSSEADFEVLTPEQVEARLVADLPNVATYGAFLPDGSLTGMATILANTRQKTRHKAMVVGMYVTAAARGQRVGRRLLDAVIAHGRELPHVEELQLAVTVGNDTARRLYLTAGFTPYAVEPRSLKIDGQYYDLEWMEIRL